MRKTATIVLGVIFIILCYFTFKSARVVLRSDWQLPEIIDEIEMQPRLVLITQDIETPFWDKVGNGALEQADVEGVSLEIWGSYGNNQENFLKKMEIAIYSKVDGIIVQGLDNGDFKDLTKFKASFYGIPIITVANDVPMDESLRRTYVGSDQHLAGRMIAKQLLSDMGSKGTVVLMYNINQEYYQKQRLSGIEYVLKSFPNVQVVYAETSTTREGVIATTQDVLNRMPDANAFIAVNANIAGAMIQEISKRSQLDPFHIYSFDDGPESMSLLMQGKLSAMIEQSPGDMGRISVQLMMQWIRGETVPLDKNGYFTGINILKAIDVQLNLRKS